MQYPVTVWSVTFDDLNRARSSASYTNVRGLSNVPGVHLITGDLSEHTCKHPTDRGAGGNTADLSKPTPVNKERWLVRAEEALEDTSTTGHCQAR